MESLGNARGTSRVLDIAVLAAAVWLTAEGVAQAYVDPGTGSFIVQLGIAAVAGTIFYCRRFLRSVLSWRRRDDGPDHHA